MDIETLLSYEWKAMIPEFIIFLTIILISIMDLFRRKKAHQWLGWFAFSGIVFAIISVFVLLGEGTISILYDTFVLDQFAKLFKWLLLVGAGFVLLLAVGYQTGNNSFPHGEFYYLFLTALLGAMIMSSSGDLLTLFVGLELLSISSYILVGLKKKRKSTEAALKYVINGGIATAITLFGLSYLYGLSGSTKISDMVLIFAQNQDASVQYVLGLAFLLTFVGLSFKIASVPFHMWAPDVYEGAPTPVTSFLSVVSKTAGFILLIRVFLSVFGNAQGNDGLTMFEQLKPFIAILAILAIIVGNVIALRQMNVKRMLAYSSIAHAGYILVAFVSLSPYFYLDTIWFYLLAYLLMNIGAFAVIQVIGGRIESFAGLYRTSPFIAIAMTVFLLSLAGIPGTAGFIAKLHILLTAFSSSSLEWALVIALLGGTIVSYVYYFGVMVQMYFRPPKKKERTSIPTTVWLVVAICFVFTLALGIYPQMALDIFHRG
ncbi:NADH-quinone oxidoreductase subunit NuoN [Bacillus kexueae]|uniref:NADH-quinone oxidoreductase subunit NuoN n=1 Tax=Aeribacillus kexueae TaxID=2078952 RepID=UPI001FAFB983|nr:NADH-quinone oxidoreductase subunit NuoN [Bacillus kexueae]